MANTGEQIRTSGDLTPAVSVPADTPVIGTTGTETQTDVSLPPNTATSTDPSSLHASIQDFHVQLSTLQK